MRARLTCTFVLTFMFMFVLAAHAATAGDILKAVQEKFPEAKIVSKAECELGKKKIKVVGAVVRQKTATGNPLAAVILEELKGKLQVNVLSKKFETSNGGMDADFLADFWDASSKKVKTTDIRCVVPGKDKDIAPKAHGEFTAAFKSKLKSLFGGYGNHLCFQASTAYNSWSCFNYDGSGKIQNSYVQMNAD
jgi:hypothetical protein